MFPNRYVSLFTLSCFLYFSHARFFTPPTGFAQSLLYSPARARNGMVASTDESAPAAQISSADIHFD